jgi:hypothetical protein
MGSRSSRRGMEPRLARGYIIVTCEKEELTFLVLHGEGTKRKASRAA